MFFLFFFFPFPHPPPPLPSDVRGKNKQDKQIQISYFLLDCFLLKWSHTNWPQICVSMHKWTNNEWAGMKMKSYWKWTLCIIIIFYIFFLLQWLLTTSAQMFRISNREAECSPSPAPQPPTSSSAFIFIYFSHRRTVSHQQWCNSIFICFLLFGFHRKGRWAFLRLICLGGDPVPAFRASGAVWTKPSVWVGRFIKWQTGSLCLANVPLGRRR